jgi:hypothetical protein
MTDEDKRHAIREFFTVPRPVLHPRTLVIGGCLVFLGLLSAVSGDVGAGAVAAGLGAGLVLFLPSRVRAVSGEPPNEARYVSLLRYPAARRRFRDRVGSERVTAWLMEEIRRVEDRSSEILGLDETTRDPLCVVGPLYSATVAGVDPILVLRRRVPDGYLYSTYCVSIFQFSESSLAYDQVHLNLITGAVAAERTGELFYRDVVAVRTSTESSNVTLKSGETLDGATTFSLTAKGGERVQVVLDAPAIAAGEQIRSLGEGAVDNIRAMVRQYKNPE